jgi:hypothetical protein
LDKPEFNLAHKKSRGKPFCDEKNGARLGKKRLSTYKNVGLSLYWFLY